MSILDNEGHDPNGLGNRPTRTEIARLDAEITRLQAAKRAALKIADERVKESAKLRAALVEAPRPSPAASPSWLVAYMDWFFKTRIAALGEGKDG